MRGAWLRPVPHLLLTSGQSLLDTFAACADVAAAAAFEDEEGEASEPR